MVRPYKVKGEKRKRKEENYDKEEREEFLDDESTGSAKRVKTEHTAADTEAAERAVDLLAGIPVVSTDQSTKSGVIFIIERASLEIAKIGKTYQLLNSDEHSNFLKKNNRNPSDYRPDNAHQAMLAILDSRVNKAGRLKALYVKTEKDLLQKLSITAVGKLEKLLRVIKKPCFTITTHWLPEDRTMINGISNDMNLVIVIGAMARGKLRKIMSKIIYQFLLTQ